MTPTGPTDRTTVKRRRERGVYDREAVHAIIDEALVCHVGFVADGAPVVIPTIHGRSAGTLYLHGSVASRMLRALTGGVEACVTMTIVDGLVLARSAMHHSMNYRSVVVFGTAEAVTDPAEKLQALRVVTEHVAPGRWAEVRPPTDAELRQTLVLRLPLDEASAKIRAGGPVDDEQDHALPVWAGVVPLRLTPGPPVPDDRLAPGIEPSAAVRHLAGRGR